MSVSRPLPHDAAALHVRGAAHYVDDIPTPRGTLHLCFGLSEVAAGRITGMDLDAVRAAPGVVAVLRHGDWPHDLDCSPSAHDEPLLADGAVHYAGQPLFLVVADSHLAARRDARLGRIAIAETQPILTIDDALAAESHFEDGPICWSRGDPDRAIAAAQHRVDGVIEIGGQEHFYLEGQAALALPQDGGDMVIHASTQHPTEVQHKVAHALCVPMHAVRVETRRMGGGFGGKESQGNALAIACAVAAALTGRPCKMRYDRDDDMTITGKRHDFRIAYAAGCDTEGRLRGVEFVHYARCGWSQDLSLPVADRAMLHADNAYLLPTVRITSHRLRTNTQSATAFRGFGGPQGMLGIERVMDHIAHRLGRDPAAVRQLNYYPEMAGGDMAGASGPAAPARAAADSSIFAKMKTRAGDCGHGDGRHEDGGHGNGGHGNGGHGDGGDVVSRGAVRMLPEGRPAPVVRGPHVTPYGMEVTDFNLHALTDRLLLGSDYAMRRRAVADWNAANPVLKKGIAFSPVKFGISFTLSHLNQAGALVHVYTDGSVHLNHGGTEMGQGLFQKVAQVAADRFGIDTGRVRITATDTAKVPNTSATAASSGSDLNGMAVLAACDTIRGRIAACLAERHRVSPDSVRFAAGRVDPGARSYSFAEAAQIAYESRVSLSATGYYRTPDLAWDRIRGEGRPFYYFAYGAAVTEVVIDTLSGENRILRADILHDAGRSLNPAIDLGQIEGGYVQGAGWLTCEELVWDGRGRLRTHAPSTYKIPAFGDRPEVFNVSLWDAENRMPTIHRSKAVGEPPLMLGISAFLALGDAVAACGPGYPALDAPATPERILRAVQRQRTGA